MDKYQEVLLNKGKTFCVFAEDEDNVIYNAFTSEQHTIRQVNEILTNHKSLRFRKNIKLVDHIELKQLEDINKKKYFLFIYNEYFKEVYYYKNDSKIQALKKYGENLTAFGIVIDFDDKINKITIEFKNDMAEPLTFTLIYVDADKEAYYDKLKIQEMQKKIANLNVSHLCGSDLVTIKFQNCCNEVKFTQILLFDDKKQPMGKFKVDDGMLFKSITSLAYGKYFYKVEQYDKEKKLIVSTDFIEFRIAPPYYGGGTG